MAASRVRFRNMAASRGRVPGPHPAPDSGTWPHLGAASRSGRIPGRIGRIPHRVQERTPSPGPRRGARARRRRIIPHQVQEGRPSAGPARGRISARGPVFEPGFASVGGCPARDFAPISPRGCPPRVPPPSSALPQPMRSRARGSFPPCRRRLDRRGHRRSASALSSPDPLPARSGAYGGSLTFAPPCSFIQYVPGGNSTSWWPLSNSLRAW